MTLATTPTPKATVHTTAERPTTVSKTTHSRPTTAPKTTHSHPTTAPKTTHSNPTTAPKTTHSQPTTAPKTTHSRITTAPKTTHSQPTTVPKTTHSRPTTAPKTTAFHTPGNTTGTPTHTTAVAANTTSNATGSTVGTTAPAGTTLPRPENVIPSYQFKNGSEVMMLFVLNATLKIRYNTTNNETGEAVIPIGGKINGTEFEWSTNSSSWSADGTLRDLMIVTHFNVPDSNSSSGVMGLWLDFQRIFPWPNVPKYPLYNCSVFPLWTYSEPLFPRDVMNYGKQDTAELFDVYTSRRGKTYSCSNWTLTAGPVTIIMDHVKLQPYANFANGTFGNGVDDCMGNPTTMEPTTMKPATANATMTTTAFPTKPSPNNGGMIAGIVIGVLAFIAIIVGIAVFVIRKRRMKEAPYGHLDEEHKDYVH
ncbi:mucin-3A-like isoform X2 [Patiria miniata]|nr:mucin-3A-like isoform X2 [Patiria miniata]